MYQGVWVLSYKTVLFNALMMAVKERMTRVYMDYLVDSRRTAYLSGETRTEPQYGSTSQGGDDARTDLLNRSRDSRNQHELPFEVTSPAANPQDEGTQSQVEALLGEYPWEAAAAGRSVVYVAGAWAFLHPSHQHLLYQAREKGDHICVGVHDGKTRIGNYAKAPEEKYEVRLERIRIMKRYQVVVVTGVHSMVKRAPWKIDEEFIHKLGISKVFAGRRCSADTRDPYYIAEKLGIFEFVEDPYAGLWRRMIKVMFSNVDASNEMPVISSPKAENRRDRNWSKDNSPNGNHVSPEFLFRELDSGNQFGEMTAAGGFIPGSSTGTELRRNLMDLDSKWGSGTDENEASGSHTLNLSGGLSLDKKSQQVFNKLASGTDRTHSVPVDLVSSPKNYGKKN
eukprot:g10963.t1